MKARRLGGLTVSEIGAGAMSISASYGTPADRGQGIQVLRAAHDAGVTSFKRTEDRAKLESSSAGGHGMPPLPRGTSALGAER